MPSPDVVMEGEDSFGGEPPDARARSAGGLYLPPNLSSACNSLALFRSIRMNCGKQTGKQTFWQMQLKGQEVVSSHWEEPSNRSHCCQRPIMTL